MKTIIETARSGNATPLIERVAKKELLPKDELVKLISHGKTVIPANSKRYIKKPCGIGKKLSVKINANIGTSPEKSNAKQELKKLRTAVRFGCDTVMDLSVGGNLREIRKLILTNSPVPVGTVPVYEAAKNAEKQHGDFRRMAKDDLFDVLKTQAKEGVDFFTIHSGITQKTLRKLSKNPRLLGIVSRGGAILANWMAANKKENPFFEFFDEILAIAKEYDITLSLGDGLRPGSIFDATDCAQIAELKLLGELAKTALKNGVQVMIEGPGHVPLNQIRENIELEKKYCHEAPFYVLGPLVTDIGAGYDHITAAIGSCVAAMHGADFLCFVTPAEHIRLPDEEDIKLGVIASKIAAHSADLARLNETAWQKDRMMSIARKKRDWQKQINLSFDPEKIRKERLQSKPKIDDVCTMCGEYCSIKLMDQCKKRA